MKERKIIVYPKTTHGLRSKAEKWGVAKRKGKPLRRKLLILGTGRCGTSMLAKTFQKAGYDVGHEKVGEFGTVSLFFNVDSDWYPRNPWTKDSVHVGERRSDFKFEHVFHVVRDPLKTIPSMTGIFPALNYEFFEDNGIIPKGVKPALLKCAHVYYGLNKLAEKQATYSFRVEDFDEETWAEMLIMMKLPPCKLPEAPRGKSTGFRKRPPTTWGELNRLDPALTARLMSMARRYGYEV